MAGVLRWLRSNLSTLFREYEFVTAVYLLEPWERRIVNSVMAAIAAFTLYSAYNYVPHYVHAGIGLIWGGNDDRVT